MVLIAVAVTAVMIENSRLGYWLGVSGVGLMLVIAGIRHIDAAWVTAVALTAVGGVLLADRRLGGWIRMEGPVAPIPSRAVALGLVLLAAPIFTALSVIDGTGNAIVWLALAAWAILFLFVRRLPGCSRRCKSRLSDPDRRKRPPEPPRGAVVGSPHGRGERSRLVEGGSARDPPVDRAGVAGFDPAGTAFR